MSNKANALAHMKWMCKYHIVFTPKYRRKIIYNQYRKDLGKISKVIRELCRYKGARHTGRTFDAGPFISERERRSCRGG